MAPLNPLSDIKLHQYILTNVQCLSQIFWIYPSMIKNLWLLSHSHSNTCIWNKLPYTCTIFIHSQASYFELNLVQLGSMGTHVSFLCLSDFWSLIYFKTTLPGYILDIIRFLPYVPVPYQIFRSNPDILIYSLLTQYYFLAFTFLSPISDSATVFNGERKEP